MEQIGLQATVRSILGKKVRFLRRKGLTPAHLYGSDLNSIPLEVETPSLRRALTQAGRSVPIALSIDGQKNPSMVLVREIQRDPKTSALLHVDFYQLKMTERLRVDVPLTLTGEAPAVKAEGGILVQSLNSLHVECLPGDLPPTIEVDLSGLEEIDQIIRVGDLTVSSAITVLVDPEQVVVRIARPRVEVEEVEEIVAVAEEEAVEAPAEPSQEQAEETPEN